MWKESHVSVRAHLFLVGFRIIFRVDVFFSDVGDGWNFGRYPRKNLLFEKRESKSTSCLKTSENNRQTKIYTSTSTERISSKSRCRSRRPQTCANSRHSRWEFVFFISLAFCLKLGFCPKKIRKIEEIVLLRKRRKKELLFSLVQQQQYKRDCSIFFFKLTPLSLSLSLSLCVCVSFINAGSRNKSPPPAPPRSCSSTPPRRRLKSWASRSKTASRTPRRKSLSNRSFRTEDRLSTSRRTGPRMSRLLTGDWRRTWRDRMLGARRLRERRAWTSRVVRRNNLKFVKICDWLTDDGC